MFAVPSSAFLPFQVLSFQVRRSKFCAFCGKNVRRSKFCFFCRSKWLQLERRSKFGFSRSKCCSFQVRRSKSCAPICRNALRYFEYPSVIKPVSGVRSTFPKVTICLNSMHSQQDLDAFYPGLAYLMPMYYGQLGIIHRQIYFYH